MLFNILINDLDAGTECTLSKFADNAKLRGVAETPCGCAAIQSDLDRLENWALRDLVKFNKGNAKLWHRLGGDQLESSSADKDVGVRVDRASSVPSWQRRLTVSWAELGGAFKEGDPSALVRHV